MSQKMPERNDVAYRKARPSDFQLIEGFEAGCFNVHDRFKPHQIKHSLLNPNQSIITDIILAGGSQIGWASFFTRSGSSVVRLYTMCILPEFGGKGFARQYLEKRFRTFKNYKRVVLEVRSKNNNAIHLYEKLGFQTVKKIRSYYPDGEDGLKMVKIL
jgi:[ribosomal protein S18]-alanine N-acetyltransferase